MVLAFLAGLTSGMDIQKSKYNFIQLDRIIELCDNEGVESFTNTNNKELLVVCNNGSQLVILTK